MLQDNAITQVAHELHPRRLLPSLAAGLVTGIIAVTISAAFAALVFAGDLSGYLPAGIGMMLFGSIVIAGLTALTSSLPGLVASLQDSAVVVLALLSTAIVQAMPASATSQETFFTVVAAIALTSLLTGAAFFLLGQFKLGNLIRFIPYPVIGGFLAGTGLLLVLGAISVMVDAPVSLLQLSPLVRPDLLMKWLPGLLLAVLLLAVSRRWSHVLIVPGILLAAVAMFYVVLWLTGTSVADAAAQGWLLGSLSTKAGGLWQPLSLANLELVNWSVLGGQIGSIVVIMAVSAISMLLNATGIELATGQEVDLNRELKAAGISNLVAGLGGGMVGYHALSDSTLVHKMGARSRLVGLFLAAVCGGALLTGRSLLPFFPNLVLGGLLLFLGLDFLVTWLYDAWFKLPLADYLIVILIMVVINAVGLLQGVGLGVALAVVSFVVGYSRIGIVRHVLSGATCRSNVERPRLSQQLLREQGHLIYVLGLQGFIFFGTASTLVDQVRQRIDNPDRLPPRFVVLDFRLVSGLDASAAFSFAKLKQLAQARDIVLVFTHLSNGMRRQLAKEVFKDEDQAAWRIFPDLDHGVEWCEDRVIQSFESAGFSAKPKTLMKELEKALPASVDVASLMSYLERRDVEQGYYLIHQGADSDGLYFIEAGQVTVQFEHEDGRVVRLRTIGAGTVVGELGTYLGRPTTASVVATHPSTFYHLSTENLARMERASPEIAAAFHKFIACLVGERLVGMNDAIQALLG